METLPFFRSKYDPLSLMSPLMRNWTEPVAEKRDKYDYDYGRGVGMIDDNITYEYRVKKIAQEQAEKNKKSSTKKSTVSGKKKESNTSEASPSNVMDRIWHELKEIRKEMRRLPEMIEKMNKTGVFYRTGNMEEEEENLYGDINESTNDGAFGHKEFVYQSDKDNYRTPSQGKINKQKDDDEGNVPYYGTSEYLNSFKGDWSDPIEVTEVSHEKAVTSLDTNEISSHESGHYNGVDEQVEKGIGKRKRTASRAIKSPFVVVKPIKRAKRSAKAKLFNKVGKKSSADVDVMNAYSSFLLGEAKDERYIIPTWRVTWLLEYRKDKNVNGNEYQKVSNSNEPVNRCMNEYFKAPKTYMALNKDNTHWVTVVMHKEKEEFQVLDSLMEKGLDSTTRKLVEDLRREIGADIAEANATGSVQYPDVSTWPIKTYDMPQQ
ncbi:Sentrin-specific protease 2 [Hordeum vulgare]|nr:Sentrin-specific protease 2 [Hordeum vulgare]